MFPPSVLVWLLVVCALLVQTGTAVAVEHSIAVVVSRRIKPYMQVLKGVEQGLESQGMEVFFLSPSETQARVAANLVKKEYDLLVAIGPEAGQLLWSTPALENRGKIYSAILDSDKVLKNDNAGCGVSLQIPVDLQINAFGTAFPDLTNLGLLFDREYNQAFFEKAVVAGEELGVNVIPLAVNSKKEIPRILKANLSRIDCIWMVPDRTVISEKIVQYVIKQALYQKTGVIGYNSFFVRSGAVFAFEFDYTEIGLQTADRVKAYFDQGECSDLIPLFHTNINRKMARSLGMRVGE